MAKSINCYFAGSIFTSKYYNRTSNTRVSNLQGSTTSDERKCQRGSKRSAQQRAISVFDQVDRTRISVESKGTEPYKHCFRHRANAQFNSKQSWNEEVR